MNYLVKCRWDTAENEPSEGEGFIVLAILTKLVSSTVSAIVALL